MTSQRVTMITLAVADIEVAREFYTELHWTEAPGGNDSIAFFKLNGQFLALYLRQALANDLGRSVPAKATGAITLATNYSDINGVDQAFENAVSAGAEPVSAPKATDWGGYSGMIADRDGHLWEYAHNPFWTLDENGYLAGDS